VGDDRTDLDAFREATIKIAVRSAEGPPELIEQADACVDGPDQVVELLASL
jgi:soluble P-type ATPase